MHDDDSGENTTSIVNHMLVRRRRNRTLFFLGLLVGLGLIGLLAMNLATSRQKAFANEGVGSGLPPPKPPQSATPPPGRGAGKATPKGGKKEKTVEVTLDVLGKGGALWLDGRLLGSEAHRVVRLTLGKHDFTLHAPDRVVVQKLQVTANDVAYHVEFGDRVKVQRTSE